MIVQPAEHFDHECYATFERLAYAYVLGVQRTGYLELTPQFVSRTPRIDYELPKLSGRSSPTSFGDIGQNRDRGANELVAARNSTGAAKRLGQISSVSGDLGRDLVYEETSRVRANGHATA